MRKRMLNLITANALVAAIVSLALLAAVGTDEIPGNGLQSMDAPDLTVGGIQQLPTPDPFL